MIITKREFICNKFPEFAHHAYFPISFNVAKCKVNQNRKIHILVLEGILFHL